jgi:hypothetical protein
MTTSAGGQPAERSRNPFAGRDFRLLWLGEAVGTGAALGYGNLLALTWVQSRIPPVLMGRVMSLLITGSVGLIPVSVAIAGAAVEISLEATMLVAGAGMALLALLSPAVRNLGLERPQAFATAAEASA